MIVSAIFFVDHPSTGAAAPHYEKFCAAEKICSIETADITYLDFWSKFRDTVMPDKPQNNNPPKEMRKHKPRTKPPQDEDKPNKPNKPNKPKN